MTARLALLITGEVRFGQTSFDPVKGLDTANGQAVFSVWDKVGRKIDGWLGPWQVWRLLGPDIGDSYPVSLCGNGELQEFLPDFFNQLREGGGGLRVDPAALERLSSYTDIEDQRLFVEVLPPEDRQCNARFIHYKFARALQLMKIAEDRRGCEFENVARIRPDFQVLPDWSADFGDKDIFVDWWKIDELGEFVTGDNAILARRDIMFDLCEHMRVAIYEERKGNIHRIIGEFIEARGLNTRLVDFRIAEDLWPRDSFLAALTRKLQVPSADRETAREFLCCVRAYACLSRNDLTGAAAELHQIASSNSPAVGLCRGRLALEKGELAEVDSIISRFEAGNRQGHSDICYYQERLVDLREEHARAHGLPAPRRAEPVVGLPRPE